ncbi:MAG: hypothetical protein LWX01_05140 [Deltaproteobacteria bacterium]|nr:hypothetical protein [Deltaproteobacteria bacterium]
MVKKLPCWTVTMWGQTGNAPNGITMAFNTLILGKGTAIGLYVAAASLMDVEKDEPIPDKEQLKDKDGKPNPFPGAV